MSETMPAPNPWMPTTNQIELAILGKINEEAGECSSASARCIIQGIREFHPVTGKSNQLWLEEEIADVFATAHWAIDHFRLDMDFILARIEKKRAHFDAWKRLVEEQIPPTPVELPV